jgi:hypothetical protein
MGYIIVIVVIILRILILDHLHVFHAFCILPTHLIMNINMLEVNHS